MMKICALVVCFICCLTTSVDAFDHHRKGIVLGGGFGAFNFPGSNHSGSHTTFHVSMGGGITDRDIIVLELVGAFPHEGDLSDNDFYH